MDPHEKAVWARGEAVTISTERIAAISAWAVAVDDDSFSLPSRPPRAAKICPSRVVAIGHRCRITVRDCDFELDEMPVPLCWRCAGLADFPVDGLRMRPICAGCAWACVASGIW